VIGETAAMKDKRENEFSVKNGLRIMFGVRDSWLWKDLDYHRGRSEFNDRTNTRGLLSRRRGLVVAICRF
jgi:hypothetical protein